MTEKQMEVKQSIADNWDAYRKAMPEIADAYDPLPMEVYKDGYITGKHKRLMAMVAALCSGCRGCILFQTGEALKLGATVDEVLEACAVAISLGGTMGSAQVSRVVEFLREEGLME